MEKIIRKFIKEQIKNLAEAEVKGDVVNLHYRFDQVDDTKGIKQNLQNNETVNKYKIKVEFGEDKGNSFDVKFTIDRKKTAAMTAIRLLRDEVLEPIEKANKAVIIDIEPKNFKPKIDYDQMAQQSAMDDRRQQGLDPGLEEAARELGYLNELNSYEMGKLPDFELLRKNVSQMLGVEVDDDVRSGMYDGKEGYYSRISPRDLIFWEKEQIEKLKQAFKKTNFESDDYEFEYDNIFDFEEDPGERTYPAGFGYFATEKKYGDDDKDNFPDLKEAYTSEWDPETAAKNLRVAKGIEPKYTTYTKGEKVTYLGHPAVITGVKEYNGKIYYSVSYDKGNGKTKASSILSTDGTIKSLEEAKSKEDQLKIARAAFEKAEMNGDIRGQELALAAIDLIKGKSLKEMASELGYLNEDEQLSKLLQLSKHADVRDGEEKISKLAAAWDRWNYDNGDKYDDLVTHLFMAAELLGDGYRKDAQMRLRMFNKDVVKIMGGLNEEKKNINEEKSSLFSQTLVDDIEKEIREITGILEDGYNENVGYQEYKFKDGTGGFAFKWSHAGNWGGRLNLSLSEDGNHTIETLSYYDDRVFNAKTKFKSVQTWEDLSDDDLSNIFRKLQPYIKKNETLAKKALSDEAKAQSDYYANKPDTGRIGYGLSQQPRKRN